MKRLVAFDPGGTTGYCIFEYNPEDSDQRPRLVESGQLDTWQGIRGILEGAPDAVVCESFRVFAYAAKSMIGDEMITSQVIGAMRMICDDLNLSLIFQNPSEKMFFTNKRLREYGYIPAWIEKLHDGRHALDAIRHALYFLHFKLGIKVKPE